jgi:hypothetical protein
MGGLFAIVGGVVSASLILAMKKTTSKKDDPVVAHSFNPILSDRSTRPINNSLSNSQDVREYAYDVVPLEPDAPDEPTVLSTKDSRIGVAVACWFFAMIWNSITWTITYFAWRDGSWFGIAFSSIFVVVGIAILLGAVYATLQIFNPKPTLVCSQNRLYPGTEFEVSWTHRGNTGRIQELRITLEGIEEATFKQGTSNRTERSLFHQQTIVQTTDSLEINEGYRVLTLPADTMHSFKSSRNAILWILKVHGKIAWWPDMTDQFPITIYPPALESEPRH